MAHRRHGRDRVVRGDADGFDIVPGFFRGARSPGARRPSAGRWFRRWDARARPAGRTYSALKPGAAGSTCAADQLDPISDAGSAAPAGSRLAKSCGGALVGQNEPRSVAERRALEFGRRRLGVQQQGRSADCQHRHAAWRRTRDRWQSPRPRVSPRLRALSARKLPGEQILTAVQGIGRR